MEKQLSDRDDSSIPPGKEPSKDAAKDVMSNPHQSSFALILTTQSLEKSGPDKESVMK
ncbi:hypothetical protein ACTJK9_06805 [Pseudomonas sp. 22082]|uniref:hypothetical protein n=1 Tax=Pseudomonas sp. 22082 TaxID=3453868 RepID=UPI003F82D2DB